MPAVTCYLNLVIILAVLYSHINNTKRYLLLILLYVYFFKKYTLMLHQEQLTPSGMSVSL